MLFNLTTRKLFKCIQKSLAIKYFNTFGPKFGDSELGIRCTFDGEMNNCYSVANRGGFMIEINYEGKNMLTNLKCEDNILGKISRFTVSELEEWEIIFED